MLHLHYSELLELLSSLPQPCLLSAFHDQGQWVATMSQRTRPLTVTAVRCVGVQSRTGVHTLSQVSEHVMNVVVSHCCIIQNLMWAVFCSDIYSPLSTACMIRSRVCVCVYVLLGFSVPLQYQPGQIPVHSTNNPALILLSEMSVIGCGGGRPDPPL